MTTIMRFKNFKLIIHEMDHMPEHVHIEGPNFHLKIGLNDCECYYARGVNKVTINRLEKFVKKYQDHLLEAWRSIHEEE